MAVRTPDNAEQVESRMKIDVQREAPDSNPYLKVHWLRSVIAAFARRIFDFYQDLNRTESRLFPNTADNETALVWGNIYVGPRNGASGSQGFAVAQGALSSVVSAGTIVASGSVEYTVQANSPVTAKNLSVISLTRSDQTATAITATDHGLASAVPVSITGADDVEYNVPMAQITVISANSFTYQVINSPPTPATGTISAQFETATVQLLSNSFGQITNLPLDAPLQLQSPQVGIDNILNVDYGTLGGGSDEETIPDYKSRYLDKIQNPVSHFNASDIVAEAKSVAGVTRVFVEESGDEIGSIAVASLTRVANVATATTVSPHGYDDGANVSIAGANEVEYNVINSRIIVESTTVFHFIVTGNPATPAGGTITASANIPLGQVRTFFMRDNDTDPIPDAVEVAAVKAALDMIKPANTASADNIVSAPTPIPVNYNFTEIVPDTPTMREAIDGSLIQFHSEETSIAVSVDEDAYRAAIKNTVDPSTGDIVNSFSLSTPSGDIPVGGSQIATKGTVTFP